MTEHNDDNAHIHVVLAKETMVHHYRIIEKIGAGGMGEVYLAEDTKLKRNVALKFLPIGQSCNSVLLSQFAKEAQAVARLQHPNIITVYEVNEYKNTPYISMAYIEGQSLQELSELKSFSIEEIIDLGLQISSGLTEAHEKGITHRDLKPANIMIDKSSTVKILDFGLAILSDRETHEDPDRTATSNQFAHKMVGTLLYMSPEQLTGQEITQRVDIFALGLIMYELIMSKHPFAADSVSEISARILRDRPENMTEIRSDVPYDLNRIITRCLHKNPTKRFQTARDIYNELEEMLYQLKNNISVSINNQGQIKSAPTIAEETFVLTTDLIRKLSTKNPKMIGTKLTYFDNHASSDELVVYLHGIGGDHRQFSDTLRQLPYRAIALSLYGFDEHAQLRIPIELHDHSILLHALMKDVCSRLKPKKIILIGFSSGADHLLHCVTSELFNDIKINGILALGCNIHVEDCFATSKLAELTSGDEKQILSIIKLFSSNASSINDWLILHNYLVMAFSKFGIETEPFRKFAADIYEPFKDGNWEKFPFWYKNCQKKVDHVRYIVDTGGYSTLDSLMQKHLEDNILGDDFNESTMVRVSESHMDLVTTENVLKYTHEFFKQMNEI